MTLIQKSRIILYSPIIIAIKSHNAVFDYSVVPPLILVILYLELQLSLFTSLLMILGDSISGGGERTMLDVCMNKNYFVTLLSVPMFHYKEWSQ